jgi:hypothetical protein
MNVNRDDRRDHRDGDVEELLNAVGAVDFGCFVQGGRDALKRGEIDQHGAAEAPERHQRERRNDPVRILQPARSGDAERDQTIRTDQGADDQVDSAELRIEQPGEEQRNGDAAAKECGQIVERAEDAKRRNALIEQHRQHQAEEDAQRDAQQRVVAGNLGAISSTPDH